VQRIIRTPLFSILAAILTATAFGQTQTLLTHQVRQVTVTGEAKALGQLPATQTLRLVITLPLRNQQALDNLISDLYNPNSPSYRQFLTVDQFTAQFGPTQDDYNAVLNFAEEHGLTVVATSPNRLNVDVTGPVAAIQQAFHITMRTYQHPTENRSFFAPDREPTVDLPFQLWHISGLDNYSIPHPAGLTRNPNASHTTSGATTGSGPSASFLGSDMRAAYYGGTSLTGGGQSLGLLEYYGTDLSDLQTYYKNAGQTYPGSIITLDSTDGTSTSCVDSRSGGDCDDTEQTLDMTQALGLAPGLSSLVVYVGSTDSAIFNAMATAKPLNAQLSSSWTWYPADPNTDNPYFEEFAAQGQNLFQAAGDDSKWTTSGTASEIFPADDVYLTSVGGTDLDTASAAGPWASETAWSDGGGGISPNKFAIPSWQTTAASSCSSCSKTYRNGPDVSANANFTYYVCADQTTCTANEYGGTSFAAPLWAGFLALTNQQYAAANSGKTLGFINPSFYSIGEGSSYDSDFHDITSGSNGYSATTGYDLATGWGSPNGVNLINALAGSATQTPGFSLSASPSSVSIAQGADGSTTITSTVTGGFDSAVALTASGQPSGVTITFNPTSITGSGTSSMSITVPSTVATGTYTITVTGTSGSTVETTTVSLTVTGTTAGFSISASPTSISIDRSSSGEVTITTTATGGFDSPITLSASGEGTQNSVSFSPTTIAGAGTSTMTITVGRTAATGDHTITVTGTSGSTKHTTAVTLDVLR
jgi:kumamolisin